MMEWMPFLLLLLHFCSKGVALNECNRCACCRGEDNFCLFTHSCQDGCIDGYYCRSCIHACNKSCQTCSNVYSCTNCCEKCPGNCKSCTSYTNCTACESGTYGSTCQHDCGLGCQNHQCDINSGSCTCLSNFQGNKCDQCVNGKYGNRCDINCPAGCRTNSCDIHGNCYSCRPGFTGKMCTQCVLGKYGTDCNFPCPSGCSDGSCKYNGDCYSCRPGFTGKMCTQCVLGKYGTNCNIPCPSGCNGTCKDNGDCHSCKAGFIRSKCGDCVAAISRIISDCDNTADSSNVGPFIGVGVGSVAATLVAVGIFIIIRRYIRHGHIRQHKQEDAHELTDNIHDNVKTTTALPNVQTNTNAVYENTSLPVYEELKESNKESSTYDSIDGTSTS